MDCRVALGMIEAKADGLLPRGGGRETRVPPGRVPRVRGGGCGDLRETATRAARPWAGIRAMEKRPALDAMWTRGARRDRGGSGGAPSPSWIAAVAWIPVAAALAVLVAPVLPCGNGSIAVSP